MNRTSRRTSTLVIAAVLSVGSFGLAACSGSSSSGGSASPSAATSAASGSSSASPADSSSPAPVEMTKVRMVQEWPVPDGFWIPWVVAQDKGYYKDAGIDLEIIPPPNTAATAQYLGTGRADVAFDTTTDILFAKAQDVPMIGIGNYGTSNNWGLMSLKDKPLNFADIKGKTIGTYDDSWSKAQLQIMLSGLGLKLSDVNLVIASSDTVPLLLEGKVDAITGVTNAEGSELASQGKGDYKMEFAKDHGVPNSPVWVLAANTDWLSNNKDVAQRFMDATLKGWQDAVSNPKEAVDTFMKVYPKAQPLDFTTIQWKDTMGIFGGSTITPQTLMQKDADWQSLLDAAKKYNLVDKISPANEYYTNELLGTG